MRVVAGVLCLAGLPALGAFAGSDPVVESTVGLFPRAIRLDAERCCELLSEDPDFGYYALPWGPKQLETFEQITGPVERMLEYAVKEPESIAMSWGLFYKLDDPRVFPLGRLLLQLLGYDQDCRPVVLDAWEMEEKIVSQALPAEERAWQIKFVLRHRAASSRLRGWQRIIRLILQMLWTDLVRDEECEIIGAQMAGIKALSPVAELLYWTDTRFFDLTSAKLIDQVSEEDFQKIISDFEETTAKVPDLFRELYEVAQRGQSRPWLRWRLASPDWCFSWEYWVEEDTTSRLTAGEKEPSERVIKAIEAIDGLCVRLKMEMLRFRLKTAGLSLNSMLARPPVDYTSTGPLGQMKQACQELQSWPYIQIFSELEQRLELAYSSGYTLGQSAALPILTSGQFSESLPVEELTNLLTVTVWTIFSRQHKQVFSVPETRSDLKPIIAIIKEALNRVTILMRLAKTRFNGAQLDRALSNMLSGDFGRFMAVIWMLLKVLQVGDFEGIDECQEEHAKLFLMLEGWVFPERVAGEDEEKKQESASLDMVEAMMDIESVLLAQGEEEEKQAWIPILEGLQKCKERGWVGEGTDRFRTSLGRSVGGLANGWQVG